MSIVSSEQLKSDENKENALLVSSGGGALYSDDYKMVVFKIWYKAGRTGANRLFDMIPPDEVTGLKPSISTLRSWMRTFKTQADMLDAQVCDELQSRMVAEKVEMLQRHAETGRKMQDMAVNYLEEHKDEITFPAAVKLLVEGVRIERESRGVSQAIESMMKKTDEDLLREAMNLISKAPIDFEQLEAGYAEPAGNEEDTL